VRAAAATSALALVASLATGARADDLDPRVLYAEGNFVGAARSFEARFQARGEAGDGVSAVLAWYAAGRYAHARALLASVSPKIQPGGKLAERAERVGARLVHLSVTADLAGDPLAADATIRVDGLAPERMDDHVLFDIGRHALVIEQPLCEPFRWEGVVLPDQPVQIAVTRHCDLTGTLHVTLVADRNFFTSSRSIAVDGTAYSIERPAGETSERDVVLQPGRHRLVIAPSGRLVADEQIDVAVKQTVARRYRVPWRVNRLAFGIGAATAVGVSRLQPSVGVGVGGAIDGSRFVMDFDFGRAASLSTGNSGEWFGLELGAHVFQRALWQARRGGALLALDFDPLVVRFDSFQQPATEATGATRDTIYISGAPLRFTAEWAPLQLALTVWPFAWAYSEVNLVGAAPSTSAFGAATSLTLAWHQ